MNRSIYNIIEILCMLNSYEITPGKKKFQKLVYLIENLKGVNLGLKYEIHFYGPYSSGLDDVLARLNGEGLVHYEYKGRSHLICITEEETEENNGLFEPDLTADEKGKIDNIIRQFGGETPTELELLTTTHYAFINLENKTTNSIIEAVQKIKGKKFSNEEIERAIKELKKFS